MKYGILSICSLLLIFSTAIAQNQNTSYDSLATALSGKWDWLSTTGGFAGWTLTPGSEGYTKSTIIYRDSADFADQTISYINYKDDGILLSGRITLSLSTMSFLGDTLWTIPSEILADSNSVQYPGGDPLYIMDMRDTAIEYSDFMGDGYAHIFLRDTSYVLSIKDQNYPVYNFTLFPNPATNYVMINLEKTDAGQLEIYDILGQKMYSKKIYGADSKCFSVNVSDFANGLYLVNLTTRNQKITKRLIVSSINDK